MTAKEQLRHAIDELTEAEAADTLDYLVARRQHRDALTVFLDQAPVDDEPVTDEEERAVQEARDEIARGETIPLDQLERGLQ